MTALTLTLAPWIALVLGALVSSYRTPSAAVSSGVQHLAAGVVFAAAATKVLPEVQHGGSIAAILLGGFAGLALMFLIKAVEIKAAARSRLNRASDFWVSLLLIERPSINSPKLTSPWP